MTIAPREHVQGSTALAPYANLPRRCCNRQKVPNNKQSNSNKLSGSKFRTDFTSRIRQY